MTFSARFALVPLVVLLAAACGNKDAPSPAPSSAATAPPATAAQTAAAPHTAAAPASSGAPAAGGACKLDGSWVGTYPPGPYPFSGTRLEFTFNADGTGLTDSARAKTEFAWKTEGASLSFHGVKDVRPGRFTCAKNEVGKYAFTFTPDCGTVTFKLQQDPCKGRALTADGISLKRK